MFMKLYIDADSLQALSVLKSTSEEEENAASECQVWSSWSGVW